MSSPSLFPPVLEGQSESPKYLKAEAEAEAEAEAKAKAPGAEPSSAQQNTRNITIPITHRSMRHTLSLPSTSTLHTLQATIESTLDIPIEYQKLFLPKKGLIKESPTTPLSPLLTPFLADGQKSITLLGSFRHEIDSMKKGLQDKKSYHRERKSTQVFKPATPRNTTTATPKISSPYSFHSLLPLPYFSDSTSALSLLTRLSLDPAITHIMTTRKFSVRLLAEMDPTAPYANTPSSKLLGLNRNRGEAIELRLRTDDLDGFRDYKTVRRTLVHELVHNVWDAHDAKFWGLHREWGLAKVVGGLMLG